VAGLRALEVLDSRGRPTVAAWCTLESGASGKASVPAGASTGAAEARELRDGDPSRYGGLGCRAAVAAIEGEISDALVRGRFSQFELDDALCRLDGTATKERLGANALLAVSLSFARAVAAEHRLPLYRYAAGLAGDPAPRIPRPLVNLFSGGAHAGGQVGVQDVQLLVLAAETTEDALAAVHDVYRRGAELAADRYGMRLLRADEGGLAPPFRSSEEMLAAAVECVEDAGYEPGRDVVLAVDVAASQLASDGGYLLDGQRLDAAGMVARTAGWLRDYPITSLEDPLGEEDWAAWSALSHAVDGVLLLGDDLLCTQPERIRKAAELGAANALLLKPNQAGTLTEAAAALRAARDAGWTVVASARSGETEDDWLADLAVGWAAEHVKIGSITQSERLAKYNRLLELERELR
jgi:enolase